MRGTRLLVAGAAIVALLTAGAWMAWMSARQDPEVSNAPRATVHQAENETGSLTVPREEGPLPLGKKVSLPEAERQFGGRIPRPAHPLANDGTINGIFVATATDDTGKSWLRIAIDYESGLLLYIDPARKTYMKDARGEYEDTVAQIRSGAFGPGVSGSVRFISSAPALVTENAEGQGGVDMVLNGLRFQVYAEYSAIGATEVVSVAESIPRVTPASSSPPAG